MDKIREKIDNMTWSFSRLHTYEQCPHAFYKRYIEGAEDIPNVFADNGKLVHELFAEYFMRKLTAEEVVEKYSEASDELRDGENVTEQLIRDCFDYMCSSDEFDFEKYKVIGTEIELLFPIGKYKFLGFADLVLENKENGEIILADHKQAKHFLKEDGTPLKSQYDNFTAYKRQMYIYCMGLREQLGLDVNKIVWHHFRDGGRLTVLDYSPEEEKRTIKWVNKTIANIKRNKLFKKKPSFLMCHLLCGFRFDCEEEEYAELS